MNLCNELEEKYKNYDVISLGNGLYSENNKKRYYYYHKILDNKRAKATIIMINPSEKFRESTKKNLDATIENVDKILKEVPINCSGEEFLLSSYEIINLYPYIHLPLNEITKRPIDKLNVLILEYVIRKAEIIIPAWGIEDKFNNETRELLNKIKRLCNGKKIFVITNKYPCHFGVQCTSLSRKPKFTAYKFD